MTIPCEKTNAVNRTREFLYDLLNSRITPKVPKHIRDKAASLLKHYPSHYDMDIISEYCDNKTFAPKVFGKKFFDEK